MRDPEWLTAELVEFPIPNPLGSEAKALSEALMGDHEEQYYSDETMIGLPSPNELSKKLIKSKLRKKLEVSAGRRTVWPLLPLMIKAEINPLFAVSEVMLTWIVIISWFRVVFIGPSVVTTFAGGFALFGALNIVHFWYGEFYTVNVYLQ
jgi:hypothetical protein